MLMVFFLLSLELGLNNARRIHRESKWTFYDLIRCSLLFFLESQSRSLLTCMRLERSEIILIKLNCSACEPEPFAVGRALHKCRTRVEKMRNYQSHDLFSSVLSWSRPFFIRKTVFAIPLMELTLPWLSTPLDSTRLCWYLIFNGAPTALYNKAFFFVSSHWQFHFISFISFLLSSCAIFAHLQSLILIPPTDAHWYCISSSS